MATSGRNDAIKSAFTLVELLVVLAIISLLASLLLPSIAKAKARASAIFCQNNLKQLQISWISYAHDHDDRLPPNNRRDAGGQSNIWVRGIMNLEPNHTDNTNQLLLQAGVLWNYHQSAKIYRCPEDKSEARFGNRIHPRVRSVAMNGWMNTDTPLDATHRVFRRLGDIVTAASVSAWVFVVQREDDINDAYFGVMMSARGPGAHIYEWPGAYHDGGENLSFADGHCELRRWRDGRTLLPRLIRGRPNPLVDMPSPNNQDLDWLQARTTVLK